MTRSATSLICSATGLGIWLRGYEAGAKPNLLRVVGVGEAGPAVLHAATVESDLFARVDLRLGAERNEYRAGREPRVRRRVGHERAIRPGPEGQQAGTRAALEMGLTQPQVNGATGDTA